MPTCEDTHTHTLTLFWEQSLETRHMPGLKIWSYTFSASESYGRQTGRQAVKTKYW